MSTDEEPIIHWTPLLEKYFAGTGEKSHCLSWCHKEAEQLYSRYTAFIDIPVIVLSIFNGAISVGSQSLFGDNKSSSIGVGIVALITAIMNAINSYYGWNRRVEAHKNASVQYAKLYRFISVEMGLPREERLEVRKLLRMVKDEYDKLAQSSPLIPGTVKDLFHRRFDKTTEEITKPEELNGLEEIVVYCPTKDSESKPKDEFFVVKSPPETLPEKSGGN